MSDVRYAALAMRPSVYLETTVVSYLAGWLSRNNLLVASNQELTREWWATRRDKFELFASTVVIDEARKGDRSVAAERLDFLRDVEVLDVTADDRRLAADLVRLAKIPAVAEIDALHIAVAATNGMSYLLSWNCTHIVNAVTLPRVYDVCRSSGYEPPFVCTPQELMEI
jgi:predicted nucleic acid-binding protein